MTSKSVQIYKVAKECLTRNIPFAVCCMPGDDPDADCRLYAEALSVDLRIDPSCFDSFPGFVFNYFGLDNKIKAFGLREVDDIKQFSEYVASCYDNKETDAQIMPQYRTSTDRDEYIHGLNGVIQDLKSDAEKTVISRILNVKSEKDPIDVARTYFDIHPACFRYVMFTPETGIWLASTPELLVDYDKQSKILHTMSLAGTRNYDESGEWDQKNILEHNIVTDYICDILSGLGMKVEIPVQTTVSFKNIEHLCHKITAYGEIQLSELLPHLSPTPALCGWPREHAYKQIIASERHERRCYGGFIGVNSPEGARLFVNLRCAYAEPEPAESSYRYTLFGGGGITRHSDPDLEWTETENKMKSLYNIIKSNN